MSTDFHRVCDFCLAGTRHFHTRGIPVVHRWFSGSKGVQLEIDTTLTPDGDDTVLVPFEGICQEEELTTLGEIRKQIGARAK